jgi:hypothetical protein
LDLLVARVGRVQQLAVLVVEVLEKAGERVVEDRRLVVLGVFFEQQVPEAVADLVAALADLDGDDLARHRCGSHE